ncbi:linear amide C-N hydrolase [Paenibacillus sp. 481]|uniref:linear amide C-N hydrolase n=1 Tax=Paenibacillus sp. 481 TaxID=2835869 RepID=UPI001E5D8E74|nr:linear amide C-N hydrolase [Paenibacillus sp. 481]UHA72502.1 linear amide C-N hydrolase [Paenibacillus sp. 481]
MCTIFQLNHSGQRYVCKNIDMIYDGVYGFTNQRGVRKVALMMPPAIPASWESVYGSLTVSQVGKEMPNGGINEAGLVVEQCTLPQAEYPQADSKPAVNELQWIQYMLDTCSTVQEALQAASIIRIDQSTSKLHYYLADRGGDWAVVEFLDGKMSIYNAGSPNPTIPAMTNSPYESALQEIKDGRTEWADRDDYERNSMERLLATTASLRGKINVDGLANDHMVDSAFGTLSVARREDTILSLVYDLEKLEVHVRTNHDCTSKVIQLADFNFAHESPSFAADLQTLQAADVRAQFVTYDTTFNLHVVRSFFRDPILTSIFKWDNSDEIIHFLAHYPDSFEK